MEEGKLVLTPSALLTFLAQIEELSDYSISVEEDNNSISIIIGDSSYVLESPEDSEVLVDEDAVEEIVDIDDEGYETLEEEFDNIDIEPVEGGVIKELAKTLLVGGLVRLTKNAIAKS